MFDEYLTRAQQHPQEAAMFTALLEREGVRSYLEIGCKFGGMLWKVAPALPLGARIVGVDLPKEATERSLQNCIIKLREIGYDAHVFIGDSTRADIVGAVAALGPFDCVFIDADHTLPFVSKDWGNY